jgi:hypothetical protein
MKRILLLMIFALFISTSTDGAVRKDLVRTTPSRPSGQLAVDVSIFYDSLAPYGRWFAVDEYGWVWTPYDVPFGWRPYTHGYWVYSDYGWTWVSNWRWGWAPFHYGRWVYHRHHGWLWIPGRIWGPAWVVWRHRPGWLGWAPMPPHQGWRVGLDFEIWSDPDDALDKFSYSFVEERHFTARNLDQHVALAARNVTLLENTRNITGYGRQGDRVINRGLEVEQIERASGRPIPRQRVVDSNSAGRSEQLSGTEVRAYRPNITRTMPERTPATTAPPRQPSASNTDLIRREENERRRLETEQARARKALEEQQRQEQTRAPRQLEPEQVRKRQEAERRALDEQTRRERETLKQRQETRRQVEPPAQTAPQRKPGERKELPQRKPPDKP